MVFILNNMCKKHKIEALLFLTDNLLFLRFPDWFIVISLARASCR